MPNPQSGAEESGDPRAMFLFTTPATATGQAPASASAGPVVDAIRKGAEQTGADFSYLLNTAKRESALDPAAKAPTSSATGLFQFIEQTWLGLVKSEGPKLGLSDLSGAISPRGDGSYAVANPDARQAILKLREDPALSSLLAGTLTQQNRDTLAAATGRQPSPGELYMAHLLGARGASDLIKTVATDPSRSAASDLPEAAAANRAIFYDRSGRPRSAAELYASLSASNATSPTPAPATKTGPVEETLPKLAGPLLYGLFQTGERSGPISNAVAKLWRVNNSASPSGTKTAAAPFYPRVGEAPEPEVVYSVATAVAAPIDPSPPAATPAAPVPADAVIPLPPPRPRALAAATRIPRR